MDESRELLILQDYFEDLILSAMTLKEIDLPHLMENEEAAMAGVAFTLGGLEVQAKLVKGPCCKLDVVMTMTEINVTKM